MGQIIRLPIAVRPQDAASWVVEESQSERKPMGFIVIACYEDGSTDPRIFGNAYRSSVAIAACELSDYAVNGDYEPRTPTGGR